MRLLERPKERLVWLACAVMAVAWVLGTASHYWLRDHWTQGTDEGDLLRFYSPIILAAVLMLTNLVLGWLLYSTGLAEFQRRAEQERRMRKSLEAVYRGTLQTLTMALDERDGETYGHSQRVMGYSLAVGRSMGLSPTELQTLAWGALLHDLGKIGIPDAILLKPGRLTAHERQEMMQHVLIGSRMVGSVPFLARTASLVRHHHEWYDGNGYPDGLSGKAIPLLARIFSVADAFDAMTTARPYRQSPMSLEEALAVIRGGAGSQFCPEVVERFCSLPIETLVEIRSASLAPVESLDPLIWTDELTDWGSEYYRDLVTGTQNRTAWESKKALMARMKGAELGTLLFLDVNHFKQVNDTHGHLTGDKLLADLGARLLLLSPEVYRFGGDEFLIWFPEGDWSAAKVQQLERILDLFGRHWGHLQPRPAVSYGYETATPETRSLDELIAKADQAMYACKAARRSTVI